jgi:hypothetical protein
MLKTLLAATAALALMSGTGSAQSSSYSSSTTETTQGAPPTHDVEVTTTTKRTATRHGVMIEKDEVGMDVTRPGESATTTTETRSTEVR